MVGMLARLRSWMGIGSWLTSPGPVTGTMYPTSEG